jgi:hypothetical protein
MDAATVPSAVQAPGSIFVLEFLNLFLPIPLFYSLSFDKGCELFSLLATTSFHVRAAVLAYMSSRPYLPHQQPFRHRIPHSPCMLCSDHLKADRLFSCNLRGKTGEMRARWGSFHHCMFRIPLFKRWFGDSMGGGGELNGGIIARIGACGMGFFSMCTIRLGCVTDIGACYGRW